MDPGFRRRTATLLATLVVLGLGACGETSSTDRRAEFESLLAAGEAGEVLARVKLARDGGENSASLDYGEGLALLAQNNDRLAAKRLERAVRADSTLSEPIAEAYRQAALTDHENSWHDRSKFRMREAFRYDPGISLEPKADMVADLLFRFERDYPKAYSIYRRLVHKRGPHQNKQKEWSFRYGFCLEKMGFPDDALDHYQAYRERWPDDTIFMRHVMYRTMSILLEQAEVAMEQGELDLAMARVEAAMTDWHIELKQKGRYLAGQIEERRQRPESALDWYDQVLQDEKFGGEVVQLARNRADALRAQGVH